ncbi:hypothetical protein BDFB_014029, partial [Asbolus verrucosus]
HKLVNVKQSETPSDAVNSEYIKDEVDKINNLINSIKETIDECNNKMKPKNIVNIIKPEIRKTCGALVKDAHEDLKDQVDNLKTKSDRAIGTVKFLLLKKSVDKRLLMCLTFFLMLIWKIYILILGTTDLSKSFIIKEFDILDFKIKKK